MPIRLDPEGAHLAALRRLADFSGKRVIEVGCGDGRLTPGIARDAATVFAFDPDAEAVADAQAALPDELRERVAFRVGSAVDIEIPRSETDIVVFSWSLCCMQPEDVVQVARRFREALAPEGLILDLQVIRPHPVVELDGAAICGLDRSALFARADPAAAAVDLLVSEGLLVEEAVDDHDAVEHYDSGAELVADFADSKATLPDEWIPRLALIDRPCAVRHPCRLRRLRTTARSATGR
jgi:SAM-dependent methyltransferase